VQLFIYLALPFMTRRDLHDRRAGRRKSEPYGFSFCLRASVGLRSIVGTAERLLAKDCGRDRVNPPSSQANEMSLPPGKRGWERYARVELPRIVLVVRRPLIRLVCSHAKNWAANSAHELSFMMNPLCSVMKGFMVATMNPLSWDVVRRSALSDQCAAKCRSTGHSDR
jgi:hypothetical protein